MALKLQSSNLTQEDEHALDSEHLSEMIAVERLASINPGQGLRNFRSKIGESQETLAKRMDVSRRAYQTYENGSRSIPSNALAKLQAWYGFDFHALFTGKPAAISRDTKQKIALRAVDAAIYIMSEFPDTGLAKVKYYVGKAAMIGDPDQSPDLEGLYSLIIADARRESEQSDWENKETS